MKKTNSINSNLLKGIIRSKGYTQKEIAILLKMTRQNFDKKINNKDNYSFSIHQALELQKILDIDNSDFFKIFTEETKI